MSRKRYNFILKNKKLTLTCNDIKFISGLIETL